MTPGRLALIEAMRMEQARIYGQTMREFEDVKRSAARANARVAALEAEQRERDGRDQQIAAMRLRGHSVASIALRLGLSKSRVYAVLADRLPDGVTSDRGVRAVLADHFPDRVTVKEGTTDA